MRVSVVLPCWRCTDTVRRAVDSVLSQTLAPLEVILVDDGNTDGTPSVLKEMAAAAPHLVRLVTLPENSGPGEARNAGWAAARGELVAFLDADDAWHPRKLELHLGWLANRPEVVLSGHRSVLCRDALPPAVDGRFTAERVTLQRILIANPIETRTVIIRRDVPWRFAGRHSEDYWLWLQALANDAICYVLDAPLACIFQPQFTGGGQSAALWTHECGELAAISKLRRAGGINCAVWGLASAWSLAKFVRRVCLRLMARFAHS
jgi:glycosyltransferase involved in cell wall biosynthesis